MDKNKLNISGASSAVAPIALSAGSNTPAIPPPNGLRSIITVVRDPSNHLGKELTRNANGTVTKKSSVNLSFGIAVMHRVETHDDLAALLKSVGDDPHAAIVNASFNSIEVGEEFIILSEREIESRLGIPRSDRERQKGVHQITYNGKIYKAVGRFKDNVRASCWQILDRDIDSHTPIKFANLSAEDWLLALTKILPGLDKVSYVQTESTSSRVMCDGQAVGGGNGHVWIKVQNPDDVERIHTALIVLAAQAELTWLKPRYSRKDGTVVGHSLTTIIDASVWTPGRLMFCGKPTVGDGLTVAPLCPVVHQGEVDALDTSAVVLPDPATVRAITRKAGVEMEVSTGSTGLRIIATDLTLNTEIDTENDGIMSVLELLKRGDLGKVRCQTPFRESSSFAAFFNVGADGKPFVHDVGTGTTHWLNDEEASQVPLIAAMSATQAVLERAKIDCGAPFEPAALAALAVISMASPADYQRLRTEFKKANKDISVIALDRAVRKVAAENHVAEHHLARTHHGYANEILVQLAFGPWRPVCYEGVLWVVNATGNLWVKYEQERIERLVAEHHDGKEHCARRSDYTSIAMHALSLANDPTFFTDAPVGIACPGGFLQVVGDAIEMVTLTPDHRQRVMLPFTPGDWPTPQFERFLQETFETPRASEMEEQINLLQEITGAAMTGIMPRFQKAAQFYEPYGRAGKGTFMQIASRLVPPEFVKAVSPFKWDDEYYLAMLAGARLNVVGELPDAKPIPAAAFKTVIGGDLLTGRHPAGRPISFKNAAAHIFMSNHLLTTKDQSEAFFTRWLLVEFPNSRLRLGLPIDPTLADRITATEMPGIAYWALQGAARLLRNGKFSMSAAHDRLMAQWRKSTNSLEEFIDEVCTLGDGLKERRSDFYRFYTHWCRDSGRRPFSKGKVKDLLAYNVGMGITLVELDGYETFKGVEVQVKFTDSVPTF